MSLEIKNKITTNPQMVCMMAREYVKERHGEIFATLGNPDRFGLMLVFDEGGVVLCDGTGLFKAIGDNYDDGKMWTLREQVKNVLGN